MARFPDDGPIRFVRLRDFGDVVNATFAFVRRNARELAASQLVIAGPALVLLAVVLGVFARRFGALQDPAALEADPLGVLASLGPLFVVTGVGYAIASLVSFGAVFGFVSLYRHGQGEGATAADVWAETSQFLGAIVGLVGFWLLVVLVAVPVLAVPCLGLLVVVATLVYFYPALSLLWPVRLFEAAGVFEAFRRARDLARTNWGRAAGTMVVVVILSVVASMVFSIPGVAVTELMGGSGPDANPVVAGLGSAIQMLGVLVSNTITAVATCFLHGSLIAGSEGGDLDDGLDALGREAGLGAPTGRPDDGLDPLPPAPPPVPRPPAEGGFRGGGFSDDR